MKIQVHLQRRRFSTRNHWVFFHVVLTAAACAIHADAADQQTYLSPDGASLVTVTTTKKHCADYLDISRRGGQVLIRKSFGSEDCEHGDAFERGDWTANSRFFVFSTGYLGGHLPWARPTYFYDRKRNEIYSLDKLVGPITDSFKLEPPDVVITKRLGKPGGGENQPVVVRLSRLIR